MNQLVVGLLGLGSVPAYAESNIGKEVIFQCENEDLDGGLSHVIGIVMAEDPDSYVVRYVDAKVKEKVVKKDGAGVRVKRLQDRYRISEGDVVSRLDDSSITIVNLLFSDGSILGSQEGSHVLLKASEVHKL